MNFFSSLLLLLGLFFGYRGLQSHITVVEKKRYREGELERTRNVIERDPTNSGTRAQLAEFLIEDGDLEAGIHEYRTAINLTPHGPFTTTWKRRLRDALELQERIARGEKILGIREWRVCENCQAQVLPNDKTCARCGHILRKDFWEWFSNADTQREIWREGLPIALVLFVVAEIFLALPFEVKGTLIISTVMVSGWLILRSFDR